MSIFPTKVLLATDGSIEADLAARTAAELAICPQADHFGPVMPERAGVFAGMIRDFAGRHTQAR